MLNNKVSKYIQKIASTNTYVDIYSNSKLVDFYNNYSDENTFFDDINFYMENIDKNNKVIELAAGSGRIMTPLLKNGYNVVGIEREYSMINSATKMTSKKIVHADIMDFTKLEKFYSEADVFILGATTISLFSEKEISCFLKKLNKINDKYRIFFDFFDMNSFITKYPAKVITTYGTYYYHNFLDNEKVIYNLYHKESKSLGVSIKYFYDIGKIRKICLENNINFRIEKNLPNYYMIKVYCNH